MANRNFPNGGKLYTFHVKPVLVTAKITVASTNGNGISSLIGPGIANVFMHTSTTPTNGNPNPPAGYIIVQLQDNYNVSHIQNFSIAAPNSGTSLTAVTANNVYVITALGTATAAQWQAVGVPASMCNTNGLPQIGLAFVATATGTIGGAAAVQAPSVSGIDHIEVVGMPNSTSAPSNTPGLGATMILQCQLASTVTQPADGTVIGIDLIQLDSSVSGGSPSPGN